MVTQSDAGDASLPLRTNERTERSIKRIKCTDNQGRRQKNFQEGALRIEPVLITKNETIFEAWEVLL